MKGVRNIPVQKQEFPGVQPKMNPQPEVIRANYVGGNKLSGKVALITGGDSGIGRSIAVHYAREGADVAFVYLKEEDDAKYTTEAVQKEGRTALSLKGDVGQPDFCKQAVEQVVQRFGHLDILVNNAGEQHVTEDLTQMDMGVMGRTFKTNIFSMFYLCQAVLPHFQPGSCIINTASMVAYLGHPLLLDYCATKGAVVSFTRALSMQLVPKGIRVNAVAPGPIWTPAIPATMPESSIASFGKEVPMQAGGNPSQVAPAYVFLASEDGSYFSGQVLHPNGGAIVNG